MAGEPILVVDDNPVNARLASIVLERAGYEVRSAGDAQEALELLRAFRPRLILMDVQLPGTDGLELTRRLRQDPAFGGVAIVAMTAYAMAADKERALAAGCDGYLPKPIDTRTFAGSVAAYLDVRATR